MNRCSKSKWTLAALACGLVLRAGPALACAACAGNRTDSRLAVGMNWGIFALLAVVVTVLATIASFFVFLAKRAAAMDAETLPGGMPAETQKA